MSVPRRILCPTDFSSGSDRALDHALAWSRHLEAEIHVLHVIVDPHADDMHEEPPFAGVIAARSALERLIERHGAAAEACRAVARGTSVAQSIVGHAIDAGIDLVVMGTHGRRGYRALTMGSQTAEVVRAAPCPVLAIPAASGAPISPLPRRILVPLDFGPRAAPALRYAKELADSAGGRLVLLHVIEATIVPDFYYPLGRSLFLREPETRRRSSAGLERLFWEAGGPEVPFDVRVVDGRAATDIARIAAEIVADAIVMPTHGLAEAERLVLGSTTDKVLRSASCPVLVHCELRSRRRAPARVSGAAALVRGGPR